MDSGDRPNPISRTISYRSSHIVSIPYPGRGHINPMINLCRLLSPRIDLTITIILTEEWIKLISSDSSSPNLPDNIKVRSIPNVLPSERTRGNNYTEFFEAVMSKMADPVQRVLNELNPPADIVVADALLPWIVDICKQRNVPAVSLWTESASLFFALYKFDRLDAAGGLPEDFSGDEALSYLPNVSSTHIANLLPTATTFDILRAFSRSYYWFHPAHSLLTTSFDKLEISVMEKIRSEFSIPIYQIGPLIPHNLLSPSPKPTNPDFSPYFSWLDSQPNSSVLYVSLGSFLSISDHQMEEIAMGLIQSKVKFLWVLRDKLFCVDKVDEDTGFILPWCDQLRVLCHSSVGGFLTHCGWNSTLEAIYAGVPMITYPLFWDQQPNTKLVVDDWKIGLRLKENDEETVKREMIVKKVNKLMDFDDEASKGMRERVARFKEVCQAALEVGGSSQQNLDEFLQQVSKRFN
ncbi:hypothetical protein IEQ34_009591 [Dendrobium chrysotoxum]|uniref:Glycosyltransferase n=1 Tax=Dendrobium chrysotoxum TaxID=161865 RepID=A0AAV7GYZ8_DENCH|nr:hypothetical protein IEQ34_009591 [Dendrobium chrysotoxum]